MTDDQELAASGRTAVAGAGAIREVRMFGGVGFMLNGNLVAAASRRGLLLRVGKERQQKALAYSGARPMGQGREINIDVAFIIRPRISVRREEALLCAPVIILWFC